MPKYKVDAGNSSTGPSGFVLYDIEAETPEQALAQAKEHLPESLEETIYLDNGMDTERRLTLLVYLNADALTLDDIEEDDE